LSLGCVSRLISSHCVLGFMLVLMIFAMMQLFKYLNISGFSLILYYISLKILYSVKINTICIKIKKLYHKV
jgi:hypothetical protein